LEGREVVKHGKLPQGCSDSIGKEAAQLPSPAIATFICFDFSYVIVSLAAIVFAPAGAICPFSLPISFLLALSFHPVLKNAPV